MTMIITFMVFRSLRWRFRHGKRAGHSTEAKATQKQNDVYRWATRTVGSCVPTSSIPRRLLQRGISSENWIDGGKNSGEYHV